MAAAPVTQPKTKVPKVGKPKRSLVRRLVRGVVRLVAAAVVLVVLAVIFIHTRWGKELVRGKIEAALAQSVDGHVTLGSLDYGFLFDGIDLGQLDVRDRDGKPALSIGALHVALDRGSVLDGEPEIESLEISGLAVAVVQRADGTTNLTGLGKPQPADRSPLARVRIAALRVHGGATIVQADGTTIELTDLAISGSVDARPAAQEVDARLAAIAAKVSVTRPGGAPPTHVELAIGDVSVGRRADGVDLDLHGLALGALSIERVHGRLALAGGQLAGGQFAGGQLAGAQSVAITGARVDHTKLATELGRALLVDDLRIDAAVSGPTSLLAIHGAVATRGTSLALDGTLDVSAPAHPKYQLALVGTGASTDLVPAGTAASVPPITTSVQLTLAGAGATLADVDAEITLEVGPTQIGQIAVDRLVAKAHAQRGAYTIETLSAHGLGFQVDATGDIAADTTLHGRLAVTGNPAEALAVLHAAGIEIPHKVPQGLLTAPPFGAAATGGQAPGVGRLALAVTAAGKLDGTLDVTLEPTQLALAGGGVAIAGSAQLVARKVTAASTTLALHGLQLRALAALAGKPPPPLDGTISGRVALTRTETSRLMDYDVTVALREPGLRVSASGRADGVHASARGRLVRAADGAVLGTLDAQVPIDDRGLVPARAWHVTLDLVKRPLAELIALAPEPLRGQLAAQAAGAGDVSLHAELGGSPAVPTGTLELGAQMTVPELGPELGTERAEVRATLAPGAAGGVTVTTAATVGPEGGAPLAQLAGVIDLPALYRGRVAATLEQLRAGTAFDLAVQLPERELAALPRVPPGLAALGGLVGGTATVRGTPAAPQLAANLAWHGYKTAAGGEGRTQLALSGGPDKLTVTVEHAGAVQITADITRTGEHAATVQVVAHAADTPLLPLLPAIAAVHAGGGLPTAGSAAEWQGGVFDAPGAHLGRLHWDMTAAFGVHLSPYDFVVDNPVVTGSLVIHDGALALPGTARRWDGVGLELAGDPRGVRLITLDAHESDAEVSDRRLHLSGLLTLAKLKPATLELALSTHQWLALGPRSPLLSDAPQASVDLDAHVTADLAAPVIGVDATIDHLDLRAPDRHDRAHQPDVSSIAADVVFVDDLATAGVLPHAAPVAATAAAEPAAHHALPPLDVRIHIPHPIHALKAPLDVTARGELTVTVRDGAVVTRGDVTLLTGTVNLFGHHHKLVDGHVTFDAAHPHGWLDLTFARQLPAWASRGLSQPERGATIHLTGDPAAKPAVAISGVENATLADVFSMNFAGRPIYDAPPGRPASASVEVPRGDQLNVLAYLSLVIPHLLFLDRVAAWGDPTEPRGAYGRIRNVELDRYGRSQHNRVRVVGRPQQPGRSTAEVQYDHLFVHDDHTAFGAGVRAGDRLGGGLGLFFEWTSAE